MTFKCWQNLRGFLTFLTVKLLVKDRDVLDPLQADFLTRIN